MYDDTAYPEIPGYCVSSLYDTWNVVIEFACAGFVSQNDSLMRRYFLNYCYFKKCAAYLGLILDNGNITSISAVLK